MTEITKYATVRDLSKLYPFLSEAAIRYLVFKRNENGLSSCMRRVGRKMLFNVAEFDEWIDSKKDVVRFKKRKNVSVNTKNIATLAPLKEKDL